ncbi:MAG: tRNA uridine-5-carboxymethylaminomethyl(34) synthesis GTPase MnmE [Alphaproteobacteria bacterium]|nr:tRNA uridine-5-carboxymethylaminomethyl(34) synthesis GTPase MnmE [Alphaproteobacteria bacterium]
MTDFLPTAQGETIFALASAPGRAGVAVIRISGPHAAAAAARLGAADLNPREMTLVAFRAPSDRATLDRGLAVLFPGPASFTGEDVVELHLHGGRAVLDGMFRALEACPGLRPADPGEFSRRAFLNGKMDLAEAEGLADLIDAETAAQRAQALRQMGGGIGAVLDPLREELIHALAMLEAWIDFPDEEIPPDLLDQTGEELAGLATRLSGLEDSSARGERLRDGLSMAIVGPPNSGKSSLLNALANRDVAIVSETAGTTRDVLEVGLDLNGYPVTLWDTAGLRETADSVEREGVRRALDRARAADLVIHMAVAGTSYDADLPGRDGARDLRVASKTDLGGTVPAGWIGVSVKTEAGLAPLLARLTEEADRMMGLGEAPSLTRARHRHAVGAAREAVERARAGVADGLPLELVAEDLRHAAQAIGRVTGRVDVDDLLDVIFSSFCLGK